jgi:hypothetical protein
MIIVTKIIVVKTLPFITIIEKENLKYNIFESWMSRTTNNPIIDGVMDKGFWCCDLFETQNKNEG